MTRKFDDPPQPGRRRFCLYRLWHARQGATAVEMALLLPALLLFFLGIVEFGRALWTQTSLQFAVSAAARCAAVNPSQCSNVPSYAASQMLALSVPPSVFTYTSGASCGITGYTSGSKVSASYTFTTVVSGLIPSLSSVHLSATACHP